MHSVDILTTYCWQHPQLIRLTAHKLITETVGKTCYMKFNINNKTKEQDADKYADIQ